MVQRDGRLRYVLASPGGLSQTVTNTQVLGRLIDDGVDVAAAVEAPRWCNHTHGTDLFLERELPESYVAALAAMGHKARHADDPFYYGSAKALEMMATSRPYTGRQAEAMGLANLCVAPGELDAAVADYGQAIVANSRHSNAGNKRLIYETDGMSLAEGLAHEIMRNPGFDPTRKREL